MNDLKDKVILITGASAGIGEGIALEFSKLGSKLTLTGRNKANLHKVAKQCNSLGLEDSKILCIDGDIASNDLRKTLIEKTVEKFGRLDVLVNNAGLFYPGDPSTTTEEHYDEIMNVNVKAVFFLTQLAIPYLKETKGNIINISSVSGIRSCPDVTAYSMSKAKIDMFTMCSAIELGPFGIRVNSVSPGLVISMIARRGNSPLVDEESFQKAVVRVTKTQPLGRVGLPVDVAKAVTFLASEKLSSFISGEIMILNGARHLQSQSFDIHN